MELSNSFLLYDASAGSGKTFTLVKEYLKKVLASKNDSYYKHLLAITFTNKAVAEMKNRLVKTLVMFGQAGDEVRSNPMMLLISEETGLSLEEIQQRSKNILKHLLHNYAAFSVETIDRFNHRLIRTFARDLKLGQNFEVTLDTPELLAEAVDLLLGKAGENPEITKLLLDFALEKTDDDKSWDISRDIAKAAQLLFSENEVESVTVLKEKTLADFLHFKKLLIQRRKKLSGEIQEIASQTLQLIDETGLEHSDFLRATLPNHFLRLKEGNYNVYGNKLQENLENGEGLYKVKAHPMVASKIDDIRPQLLSYYLSIKEKVFKDNLFESILKNLTPLSVVNLVSQEIENIKAEKNILPIFEFNHLINKEIKNQPAPFIYERLGEKYRHFFIDEFQDTSKLQWENLIPLIDNALSQRVDEIQGSLLLVGDAKQSIYRWRGGLPEQFMGLKDQDNPFALGNKKILNLPTNYRSCEEIIKFNNQFFSFVSSYFADPAHLQLYESGNQQQINLKKNGFVKFEFVEKQNKAEKSEDYAVRVHKTILELLEKDFSLKDISILTRKRSEGIALSTYLMEQGIPVLSSETLLLQYSPLVQLLILSLTLAIYPKHEEAKIQFLDLLHAHLKISDEKHSYFLKFLKTSESEFSNGLKEYDIDFILNNMRYLSLYEAFEYCIRQLNLNREADAYLFGFMDLVYEFSQQPRADKISFLDYWETKKEKASIPANEGVDAVRVMTIHTSKGLEFPVVIFPFADIQLYDAKRDTLWYPLENGEFDFSEAQINFKADIANYGPIGERMYHEHRSQLELDNINLLYVTLTRAIEKLYIFSEMPSEPKDGSPQSYNHLFMEFLKNQGMWDSEKSIYTFGIDDNKISTKKSNLSQIDIQYPATDPSTHNLHIITTEGQLWKTKAGKAIGAGNLLHETMEQIKNQSDAVKVFEELEQRAIIPEEELQWLKGMVNRILIHPELRHLFNDADTIYNERGIIDSTGQLLRPDRINIHPDRSATIIDYKTGGELPKHQQQLSQYVASLKAMGYAVVDSIIIYVDDELSLWKGGTV